MRIPAGPRGCGSGLLADLIVEMSPSEACLTFGTFKGVLNGFLFQARDMVNAPNGLRKATKCISGHTRKKISRIFAKFSRFFRFFLSIFLGQNT